LNTEEIISSGILELYCTGLTSAAETAEVELWAKQYPEVAAEIAAIQAGLEGYAQSHAIAPGPRVKEKVFSKIKKKKILPVAGTEAMDYAYAKIYRLNSSLKIAVAASIILLVGSLIFNYSFYNKYQKTSDDLLATKTELQKQNELAKAMHDDMGVMADKNAVPVSLNGMPDVADAAARIYWMKNTGDVYIDPSNLPDAPDSMQYQFWAIVDGIPVSGGMINTVKNGKTVHVQKMKSFGRAQAFAVSLERAGPESPAPTKVYVMGKI
jgi:anti-sigma-K factor RskA